MEVERLLEPVSLGQVAAGEQHDQRKLETQRTDRKDGEDRESIQYPAHGGDLMRQHLAHTQEDRRHEKPEGQMLPETAKAELLFG